MNSVRTARSGGGWSGSGSESAAGSLSKANTRSRGVARIDQFHPPLLRQPPFPRRPPDPPHVYRHPSFFQTQYRHADQIRPGLITLSQNLNLTRGREAPSSFRPQKRKPQPRRLNNSVPIPVRPRVCPEPHLTCTRVSTSARITSIVPPPARGRNIVHLHVLPAARAQRASTGPRAKRVNHTAVSGTATRTYPANAMTPVAADHSSLPITHFMA